MIHIHNFYIFSIASLMLNLTPGPDMLYVATRSIGMGVKAGIVSSLGVFTGCFFHIVGAVLGFRLSLAVPLLLLILLSG